MDAPELRVTLRALADRDPAVRQLIEVKTAAARGDTDVISKQLVAMVTTVLSSRGFVDYRGSFEVARDAQELLDELEGRLASGSPDAVRPALLRAVTRLQKVVQQADDSSGSIGDACQRAADLYARSCREGNPDGRTLAQWLLKLRWESPGWPNFVLDDFALAFDERALAAYRRAVVTLHTQHPSTTGRWERIELDRMRLELADHDGDVDRAVQVLSEGEHTPYSAIVQRLKRANRDDAVMWIDRAVEAGRVAAGARANEYWVDLDLVADSYRQLGRIDDAIDVLRAAFVTEPGSASFHPGRRARRTRQRRTRGPDLQALSLSAASRPRIVLLGQPHEILLASLTVVMTVVQLGRDPLRVCATLPAHVARTWRCSARPPVGWLSPYVALIGLEGRLLGSRREPCPATTARRSGLET